MKIEWNKVTWYSKLCAIIFFLLVLPILAFDIGVRYEQTKYALLNEDTINESIDLFLANQYKNSSLAAGKSGPLSITNISPVSGPTGTKVTISGSGFDASQNSVVFGNTVVLSPISSKDGTIVFTVPDNAGPEGCTNSTAGSCASTPTLPGVYVIQVANTNGVTRSKNTIFTVTSSQ